MSEDAPQEKPNHRTLVGQKRRVATEDRIVRAAMKVFAERGVDAPVIDDFIRESAVSRGTFYNYFRSTHELLDATIELILNETNRQIEQHLAGVTGPAERMATALCLYLRNGFRDRDFAQFMAAMPYIGDSARRSLASDLVRGQRAGVFAYASREIAEDLVLGTMQQCFRRIVEATPSEGFERDLAATILRGLGTSNEVIERVLAGLQQDDRLDEV
jgi:AcrR family transcriptional regulator